MLFHHLCALENGPSENQLNSSVGSNGTTTINTTIKIPNLNSTITTPSNTTVSSKNESGVNPLNSTEQLVKSSSEGDAMAKHITSKALDTQEDVKTKANKFNGTKFSETSVHSDSSHVDLIQTSRITDFEDSGSQVDPKDPMFNRDDFDESQSNEFNKFVHRSDSVVHNKYIPDISLSYILVACCIVVILILCIWKPLCHILYNVYTSCRPRSRAISIDSNSKVAYRQLNMHEF
ncbi:hypothetical protein MN116_007942 [Schistosoma mekongi]|uniref:Uncharacterized protein n=1 Tax=Schistosoma mekongi TaxID=38744 RepID=A0AAE1Z8L8_SCHME|nr:hypothetical protein MN116_007942 [Schistosoma mekongi]